MELKMRPLGGNEGGYTLLEAMVSLAILSVSLLATIHMVGMSINSMRAGKDMTIANNLMKQVVEDMKNVSYQTGLNDMLVAKNVVDNGDTVYSYQVGTKPFAGQQGFPGEAIVKQNVIAANKTFTIYADAHENTPQAKLCQVVVTVTWANASQNIGSANSSMWIGPNQINMNSSHSVQSTIYFNM